MCELRFGPNVWKSTLWAARQRNTAAGALQPCSVECQAWCCITSALHLSKVRSAEVPQRFPYAPTPISPLQKHPSLDRTYTKAKSPLPHLLPYFPQHHPPSLPGAPQRQFTWPNRQRIYPHLLTLVSHRDGLLAGYIVVDDHGGGVV